MRTTPIHDSLLRPQLLAGGERTLVMLNTLFFICVVFLVIKSGLGFIAVIAACSLATVSHTMLVLAAKKDPQAFDTYRRHVHQQQLYPASASPVALHQLNH